MYIAARCKEKSQACDQISIEALFCDVEAIRISIFFVLVILSQKNEKHFFAVLLWLSFLGAIDCQVDLYVFTLV